MRRITARPAAITRSSIAIPTPSLLGLTATPCRGDGRGLGGIFEELIECPQVAALIEQGYLVRDARLCAGRSRSARRAHAARRLRRGPARRAHGSAEADRRHRHPLAQIRRAAEDRRLRGQRRALGPSARRIPEIRRARRAHRRRHAEARARRDTRAAGIRRDRARHQLHGADRGLGHARGRLPASWRGRPGRWASIGR